MGLFSDELVGIDVTSGFKLQAGKPLDVRAVVELESDLSYLVSENGAYVGMPVYVKGEDELVVYGSDEKWHNVFVLNNADVVNEAITALSVSGTKITYTRADGTTSYITVANADAAEKLSSGVIISLSGGATGSAMTDMSEDFSIPVTALDASALTGTIDIARLPASALERCVVVEDDDARFALTTDSVQLGDTVKVTEDNLMYMVVDTDNLDSDAGYTVYNASVSWENITDKVNASASSAGLMTAAQYTKLAGIATGATKNTIDSALSTTSTNAVQNKVINSALGEKLEAEFLEALPTADFSNNFSSTVGFVAQNRCAVAINSGVAEITAGTNAANEYAYSYYNLSSILSDALSYAVIEYDVLINEGSRFKVSLVDLAQRYTSGSYLPGESSKDSYDTTGIAFRFGEYNSGYAIVQSSTPTCTFGDWMHFKVSVNVAARTVAYVITDRDSGDTLFSGTSEFLSDAAETVSGIEVYGYVNSAVVDIDNLDISAAYDVNDTTVYLVGNDTDGYVMYMYSDGEAKQIGVTAAELPQIYFASSLPDSAPTGSICCVIES